MTSPGPVLRLLLRRSTSDGQENSLDVQRATCRRFGESLGIAFSATKEFDDDGVAGDDFAARVGLRQLLAEAQPGDIVVCNDHSRLGRDMLECAFLVRQLCKEKRARLFYASAGKEVTVNNATEEFMVVAQGYGAQQEKEWNQKRTRDTLREKVRRGEIAGGRCYGYTNVQRPTVNTRGKPCMNTLAVVCEEEAKVVASIFQLFVVAGWGLKRIAVHLNIERVPAPSAGGRGTGSWSPSAIREIIRRERYRGVYVHGATDRVKEGGKRVARKADPSQVMRIEVPEWRVIDDETWCAAQETLAERGRHSKAPGPAARYPLSGIARCRCGRAIGIANTRVSRGQRVRAYTCTSHHTRGAAVCNVTVYQPAHEVEGAIIDHLRREVLSTEGLSLALDEVRAEVARQLSAAPTDTTVLEAELSLLRVEQKRCARLLATLDDAPELVAEYQSRTTLIRNREAELANAKRTPALLGELVSKVEAAVRAKLDGLTEALTRDREGAREVFLAMFPEGLRFTPARAPHGRRRQVWRIEGVADLASGFKLSSDPTGTFCNLNLRRPVELLALPEATP
jgi:DNA invertase Pin-like site-specific DNA recombinase